MFEKIEKFVACACVAVMAGLGFFQPAGPLLV